MLTVDGDEHHALAGSTPRGGECSLGGSGQVQRSLPLHIQGELDDDRDDDVTGAISCRNLTNWIEFSLKKYLFQFGLDSANGQRILPVEMAVSLWQLVFSQVRLLTNPKDCGDSCDDDTVSGGAGAAQKVASFLRETPPGYI